MRDLNDKITGNNLTADEWNDLPSEVQNVIENLGIVLSSGDLNQLGKAIAGYVANGNFYLDSGVADAYVLTVIGLKQAVTSYTDGMAIRFRPDNTNTGASTVNVSGLGVKNIKSDVGADPAAGRLSAGVVILLTYDSVNGWFEIGAEIPTATETTLGIAEVATQTETNIGTDDERIVTPLKLANRTASETRAGVIERATQAEVDAGSDNTRAVTPLRLAGRTSTLTRTGLIELATQAEVDAGTDTVRAVAPSTLRNSNVIVPIGSSVIWNTSAIPLGYLQENGAAVSRTTYAALFAVIGTSFGVGNGSTTFNLPDKRGEFLRGWDNGRGADPDAAGRTDRGDGTTGDNVGTLQADELESHTHTYAAATSVSGNPTLDRSQSGSAGNFGANAGIIGDTGGNETRPRNTNVMFCIKY